MEYVIGLDGGGTSTILKAASLEQQLLYEAHGSSCNLNAIPAAQARCNLQELLHVFLMDGFDISRCRGICLGAAGAGDLQTQSRLKAMLREVFPTCPIRITHDAVSALYGAFPDGVGIVVIAGTGSICYGQSTGLELVRTGGWGHLMGDEGSAYDIGRQILMAIMRSYDGRGRETSLTRRLLEYWQISSPQQISELVYRSGMGKKEIAAIAFLCEIGYNEGDCVCRDITESAASSITELILCTADRMKDSGSVLRCAYTGGVLNRFTALRRRVEQMLEPHAGSVIWTGAKADAAWGGIRLALKIQE